MYTVSSKVGNGFYSLQAHSNHCAADVGAWPVIAAVLLQQEPGSVSSLVCLLWFSSESCKLHGIAVSSESCKLHGIAVYATTLLVHDNISGRAAQ